MATKPGPLDDTNQTDTSDEAVSHQVIRAVADTKGVDPLDLPPLYDTIDPDALNALFDNADTGTSGPKLQFQVAGCEVLVRGDGEVTVTHSEDELDTISGES